MDEFEAQVIPEQDEEVPQSEPEASSDESDQSEGELETGYFTTIPSYLLSFVYTPPTPEEPQPSFLGVAYSAGLQ